jgi:hypothetical protein
LVSFEVAAMDEYEKFRLIEDLQRRSDEGRQRIADAEAKREADPVKMDDYLRSEPAILSTMDNVQSDRDSDELIYKEMPLAKLPTSEDADWSGWENWLRAHMDNERELVLTVVGDAMGELQQEVRELRAALASQTEKAAQLSEVKKQASIDRRERERVQRDADLAARDAKIERLELQVKMLCQFLSVSGLDLPRGL